MCREAGPLVQAAVRSHERGRVPLPYAGQPTTLTRTAVPVPRGCRMADGALASPYSPPAAGRAGYRGHWLAVLGLVGLDYFSTLAYQPSIAAEAAGLLAPLATAAIVLLTFLGALPVYLYIAGNAPPGQGSAALIEKHITGW